MSSKIFRAEQRLHRRAQEMADHFHTTLPNTCHCCQEKFRGEIKDHLEAAHTKESCGECSDFETDLCPYQFEIHELGWQTGQPYGGSST